MLRLNLRQKTTILVFLARISVETLKVTLEFAKCQKMSWRGLIEVLKWCQ